MKNEINRIEIKNKNYLLYKKKNGFNLYWNFINDEFNKEFDKNIDKIECHLKIWTKIFYEKHKKNTFNKDYKEKEILKNLPNKIKKLYEENNYKLYKKSNTRIIFEENKIIKDKKILYYFILKFKKINLF